MIVENTLSCSRFVGSLHLLPGVNEISTEQWERNTKRCRSVIEQLTANGDLILTGEKKDDVVVITPSLVKKTFNVDLLETWLVDAKGSTKRAINKQLKLLTAEETLEV